ncbi:Glucanosyltransferase-domain-containing protein [Aspergillus keveii]|uniref:1,3-beta-glucanosyltransferase n=1 Tax=Aspergillus keveii TaxID=714993 RepID=A0ABR4FRV6_9EURO
MRCWQLLLGWLLIVSTVLADTDAIVIEGTKLFHSSNGTQFYIKGLLYDEWTGTRSGLSEVDFLSIRSACERDVPVFQELGINTVGLYTVDAYANHDYCMDLLNDAGIYVVVFMNSLNTASPNATNPTWNTDEFAEKSAIVDALAAYDNVLAFLLFDELPAEEDAPYSKAKVRDMKAYIASKDYRAIPVGYGMYLHPSREENVYLNCGDEDDSVDFFALQTNAWCGDSLSEIGWDVYLEQFDGYSVPVIMAEYGCANSEEPGSEVSVLYGEEMTDVFSGGLLYVYAGAPEGLVNVSNQEVTRAPAFTSYSSQFAQASPTSINSDTYSPTNTAPSDCPSTFPTSLPPQPDEQYCACTLQHSLCISVDEADDALFTSLCAESDEICALHTSNGTLGVYGMYSMCNQTVEAAALLSNYTQQEYGDSSESCAEALSGASVMSNPEYTATGTCTKRAIYDGALPTADTDTDSSGNGGNSDTASKSGLSAGAIAGIVVGAVTGVALAILAFLLVRRRKRRDAAAGADTGVQPVELPSGKHHDKHELPSGSIEVAELPGERPELDSGDPYDRTPAELPGEGRREAL